MTAPGTVTHRWETTHGDTVEVYAAGDGLRWRVQAGNGEILEVSSEGYVTARYAIEAAERHHPTVHPDEQRRVADVFDAIAANPSTPVGDPHPVDAFSWMVEVARQPDGSYVSVCAHCGQPTPCAERIRRHLESGTHRQMCAPVGRCHITGQPVDRDGDQ